MSGNLGARGIEQQDTRIMDRTELLGAIKKMRTFIYSVLYRTVDTWRGEFQFKPVLCSKCGNEIPESQLLNSGLVMTAMNEGFGNGGVTWTCPGCASLTGHK